MYARLSTLLSIALLSTSALSLTIPSLPHTLTKRAACDSNTNALVAGINKNIDLQKQEQAQLSVVQKMVDAGNVNPSDFDAAKSKFVDIVNSGIDQRKKNQALANGNPTSDGLATVAKAQATELKTVQGLTGDAKTDDTAFSNLKMMFAGGIAQNQKNADAVCSTSLLHLDLFLLDDKG
ncbi:hypothetical protein BKA65DRAFT_405147 [Rhexocercosporidium sp. MPI-PUGE-AT-0058]|nr:hypothetical protein BKA65DRAFT_405147 [Rhexocercosporidium sp. MPI-PUGE-AT-0058]